MKFALPFLFCLGLLAALTGCSSHTDKTGLNIEAVRLVHAADGSVNADLVLLNPSVVAFNVASSKHALYLDGRLVGHVAIKDPVGVAAQSQASLTAPLQLEKGAALPADGRAGYRLETELELRLYGETVEYTKLNASGTLTIVGK